MRGQFFIRLTSDPDAPTVRWVRVEPGMSPGPVNMGTLEEAANQALGCRVIALVPGADVLVSRVPVPTANRQRMLKAIPFALEEQLADDVDTLHFAVGDRDNEGRVAAAVVNRECMEAWQARLAEAGLQADVMTPDFFALPNAANEEWQVFADGDEVLVRTGAEAGFAVDAENIQLILGLALAEAEDNRPARLNAYDGSGLDQAANDLGVEVETQPAEGGLLGLLVRHGFDPHGAINLLQGEFSRREQLGRMLRPWRLSAILVAVWLVVQLGVAIFDTVQLEKRDAALRAEVERIYKDAFPDAQRIVNPKVQMERKLAELRGGGTGDAGFLDMLGQTAAMLKSSGVDLRSVRFKSGTLDIDLEVASLQALDQLKQKLGEQAGLTVEIQSAAARGSKVEGRLQIRSAAQ